MRLQVQVLRYKIRTAPRTAGHFLFSLQALPTRREIHRQSSASRGRNAVLLHLKRFDCITAPTLSRSQHDTLSAVQFFLPGQNGKILQNQHPHIF